MKRYRILKFAIDATRNLPGGSTKDFVRTQFGELNLFEKVRRYQEIERTPIGIVEEYWKILNEIINSYTIGDFYLSLVGSCTLGERIFNRLIIKLRDYYKNTKEYKEVYSKKTINDWDEAIRILRSWKIINKELEKDYKLLEKLRQESAHYQAKNQDFEKMAKEAIKYITNITNSLFGIINRRDILLVFNAPGEVYIKKEVENIPLVQEFYISSAILVGYKHRVEENVIIDNYKYLRKEISDEEFIKLRKDFLSNH